jgi:hypothetical protein
MLTLRYFQHTKDFGRVLQRVRPRASHVFLYYFRKSIFWRLLIVLSIRNAKTPPARRWLTIDWRVNANGLTENSRLCCIRIADVKMRQAHI